MNTSNATILALETATEACSLALKHDNGLFVRHEITPRQHTESVIDTLDTLLHEAGITRDQIELIGFGRGPGSFTGVRIAAALTQGIASALDIPCVAFSTLEALARSAARSVECSHVLVAQDARRQQAYVGAYAVADGQTVIQDCLLDPEAIERPGSENWFRAGNAWDIYTDRIHTSVAELPSSATPYPHAQDALELIEHACLTGATLTPAECLPLYLRGAVDQ